MGVFLDFVRQSGTTRAEGTHAARVRRANRNRNGRGSLIIVPLVSRLASPGAPSWFVIDLGSVKRVSSFTLRNTLYAHANERKQ